MGLLKGPQRVSSISTQGMFVTSPRDYELHNEALGCASFKEFRVPVLRGLCFVQFEKNVNG